MEQTSPKIPEKKLFYSGTKQKRGRVRRNRRQMTIHPLRHTESRPPTDESAVGSPGETSCCSRGWYRHRKGQFDMSASSKCSERIRVDGNWALNAHADATAKAASIEREAIADPDAGLFTEMSHRLRPARANRDGAICGMILELSFVVIAVHDRFHVPLASRALAAGKHVSVQKPYLAIEEGISRSALEGWKWLGPL